MEQLTEMDVRILEDLPVPVLVADTEGKVTFANRITRQEIIFEGESYLGQTIWELLVWDEQGISQEAFRHAMRSGEDPAPTQRTVPLRDGSIRTFEMHKSLIRDAQGKVMAMQILAFDVTNWQAMLIEANESRRWNTMTQDAISDALITVDSLGMIQTANPAAENLLGMDSTLLIGEVLESVLTFVKYHSSSGQPFQFLSTIDHNTYGIASFMNLKRERIEVALNTFPMRDRYTGVVNGVVLQLRRMIS